MACGTKIWFPETWRNSFWLVVAFWGMTFPTQLYKDYIFHNPFNNLIRIPINQPGFNGNSFFFWCNVQLMVKGPLVWGPVVVWFPRIQNQRPGPISWGFVVGGWWCEEHFRLVVDFLFFLCLMFFGGTPQIIHFNRVWFSIIFTIHFGVMGGSEKVSGVDSGGDVSGSVKSTKKMGWWQNHGGVKNVASHGRSNETLPDETLPRCGVKW